MWMKDESKKKAEGIWVRGKSCVTRRSHGSCSGSQISFESESVPRSAEIMIHGMTLLFP